MSKDKTIIERILETNKFYCFHKTPVLPSNATLRAGNLASLHYEASIGPLPMKIEEFQQEFMQKSPNVRITLHWTLNHVVHPHGLNNKTSAYDYLIIEPAEELKKELFGGLICDLITLGDHKISNQAIIVIPEEKLKDFWQQNPNFAGKIETYDPSKVNVQQKGVEILKTLGGQELMSFPDKRAQLCKKEIDRYDEYFDQRIKFERLYHQFKDAKLVAKEMGFDQQTVTWFFESCKKDETLFPVHAKDEAYIGDETFCESTFLYKIFGETIFYGFHNHSIFVQLEKNLELLLQNIMLYAQYDLIPLDKMSENEKFNQKRKILIGSTDLHPHFPRLLKMVEEQFNELKNQLIGKGDFTLYALDLVNQFKEYIDSWLVIPKFDLQPDNEKHGSIYLNNKILNNFINQALKHPFLSRAKDEYEKEIGKWEKSELQKRENNLEERQR